MGGMLFLLVHFCVLCPIVTTYFTYVFPSLANDTHIVGPTLDVVPTLKQLHEELLTLGFLMLPTKCVVWFLQGLDHFISFLFGFFTFDWGFHILGAPMRSTSFVESFVAEVLHKDLGTIFNFLMLTEP